MYILGSSVYEIAALAKGQLISEWLFDVSNFPKRLNNADEFLPQNLEIGWIGKIKARAGQVFKILKSAFIFFIQPLLDSRAEFHEIFALVFWKIQDTKKSSWN